MIYYLNLLGLIFLVSCGNSIEVKEEFGAPSRSGEAGTGVSLLSFSDIKDEVLTPYCVKCHGDFNNYDTVVSKQIEIMSQINNNLMPKKGPLSDNLKQVLTDWFAAGAPISAAEEQEQEQIEEEVVELAPNWNSVYKNIIVPKCLACHNAERHKKGLDLSTREVIFENRVKLLNNFEDVDKSLIIERINDIYDPMPPYEAIDFESVTKEEVEVLKKWIEMGLPN